jgi:Zn-dependent protease
MSCFLIVAVIWVFSVCLHEYGHAKVAYQGGDTTVEEKGYLSMNPVHYAHPVMSFVLPMVFMLLGGIGLPGGAVYINRQLLRSANWETAVALAGPAMNLILVLIIAAALRFYLIPHYPEHVGTYAMAFALQLEISAILFNLIPIPPLDGFHAIEPWLSEELRERILPLTKYGMLILFVAFWYLEPVNRLFWECIWTISSLLGVDPDLGVEGFRAFRFWQQ